MGLGCFLRRSGRRCVTDATRRMSRLARAASRCAVANGRRVATKRRPSETKRYTASLVLCLARRGRFHLGIVRTHRSRVPTGSGGAGNGRRGGSGSGRGVATASRRCRRPPHETPRRHRADTRRAPSKRLQVSLPPLRSRATGIAAHARRAPYLRSKNGSIAARRLSRSAPSDTEMRQIWTLSRFCAALVSAESEPCVDSCGLIT